MKRILQGVNRELSTRYKINLFLNTVPDRIGRIEKLSIKCLSHL